MLGSQISNAAKNNLLDGGLKTLLPQITEKFAPKIQGISGFLKYLPAISGIIGSSIDALTTYSIAKAAQSQFLGEIIKQESFCKMQEQRIKLLINMAHIDNELAKKEEILIQKLINNSDLSEEKKSELSTLIPEPIPLKIDFSVFKEEKAYAVNMITSLISIINADGTIHPSERLYLMEIAKEVSVDKEEVTAIIESCHIK